MAPTTRSGGKRAGKTASPSIAVTGTPKVLVKKIMNKKPAATIAVAARCPLLEMPAEIRNRIYYFCKEHTFSLEWDEPFPLRKSNPTARSLRRSAARSFFWLTQTCKQIRVEYRPLWLRGSSVTLHFSDLTDYLATFHSQPGVQQVDVYHAPKMMVVLWDHTKEKYKTGDLLLDLKPLLNFRAFCKWFTIRFESRQMAERDFPHEECETCNQCINCRGRCKNIDWKAVLRGDSEDEDCDYDTDYLDEVFPIWDSCPHDGLLDEVEGDLYAEYRYLEALNCFLDNTNEAWLNSIRDDRLKLMKIECTMGARYKYPTVYIRFEKGCAPTIFAKKALSYAVCQYLTDVGIIDLEERTGLDFVVGVGTGKVTRHSADCKTLIPTYNQYNVYGRTYKEPAGIVRPAKTGAGN